MRGPFCLSVLLLAMAAPASAQLSRAQPVEVRLISHRFIPETIRLQHGQAVTLRLVNPSLENHDFHAPRFLARSTVSPADRRRIRGGRIRVPAGESVELTLVPAEGKYRLSCSERYHSTMGAEGEILVR